MTTALITHPDCDLHAPPARHPERVERIAAILSAVEGPEFQGLMRLRARPAAEDHLRRVHPQSYLTSLTAQQPETDYTFVDADTVMSPGTLTAAHLSAGAAVQAVDLVMAGDAQNAFSATRPPGHHAEPDTAMGFCFFSNAAIAARHAQAVHGLERIAVVDFDVHHGNGPEAAFRAEPTLFYASTHQHPLYPGTGSADVTGVTNNIVNVPLPPHADGAMVRAAFEARIFPALAAFNPDFIVISAGFDGHKADPLAQMELTEDDFAWLTQKLCAIAADHCEGRLISLLEGGYDLDALGRATAAHLRALMAT